MRLADAGSRVDSTDASPGLMVQDRDVERLPRDVLHLQAEPFPDPGGDLPDQRLQTIDQGEECTAPRPGGIEAHWQSVKSQPQLPGQVRLGVLHAGELRII